MSLMCRNAGKHMYTLGTKVLTEGTDFLCMDAASALAFHVQSFRFRFRKATVVALGFYKVPLLQASSAGSARMPSTAAQHRRHCDQPTASEGPGNFIGVGAQAPIRRTQPSNGPRHRVGKATGQHWLRRRCRTALTQPASQTCVSVPGVAQKKPIKLTWNTYTRQAQALQDSWDMGRCKQLLDLRYIKRRCHPAHPSTIFTLLLKSQGG